MIAPSTIVQSNNNDNNTVTNDEDQCTATQQYFLWFLAFESFSKFWFDWRVYQTLGTGNGAVNEKKYLSGVESNTVVMWLSLLCRVLLW